MVEPKDELKCPPPFAAPASQHEAESWALTNEDIDLIWQSMPGGPSHWLKGFGYQNFARAVEAELASRCRAQGGGNNSNSAEFDGIKQSSTAPTVEVDERAAFEAWAKSEYENLGGEYAGPGNTGWWYWDDITAAAWDAWHARAYLASKPPAREAAERLSIDTPEFRELLWSFERMSWSIDAINNLIAHINTWGGAAPAAGNTAQE